MFYFDAGLMPLESKLKNLIDTLLPGEMTLKQGKVSLEGYSVLYDYNFILQQEQGSKVIGNIYEVTQNVLDLLGVTLGLNGCPLKVESNGVYMPRASRYRNTKGTTNIKNIQNSNWKYDKIKDQIQTP